MMNNFIWQLVEYLFSLFESILLFNFISSILKKKINSFFYACIIILYSSIIFYLTKTQLFSNYKLIIATFTFLIFIIYMYKGTLKNKIIFTVIAFIMLVLCDIFVANALGIVMEIDIPKTIFIEEWFRVFLFCISKLILFMLLKMIVYFFSNNKLDIPLKYWFMLLSIFIISLLVLMMIGEIGVVPPQYSNKSIYLVIVSFGILIINIFMNYIFIQLSKYYEKERVYNIINIKNEIMEKHYLEREETYKEVRKLGHDFKNHILCMSLLLRDNKIDEVKNYLENISESVNSHSILIRSENDIVDAVLNQKVTKAQKSDVNVLVNVNVPKKIWIKSVDLCAILSNVIDNAIEASIKIKDETKRNINIKINTYKDYLFISVSNIVESNPLVSSKRFQTTKKDSKNHGLGVKIVQSAVKKYNGSIEYKCDNNIFTVKILIKLKE